MLHFLNRIWKRLFPGRIATWPAPSRDEILRRSRVLVIDDTGFTYKSLFKRDGYQVDSWRDVIDLPKLESGYYDVILLDIHGVGAKQSADQGLGILRHLKATAPTQLVIAYSDADWSLKYKPFFDEADAVLPKAADYVDFKRTVDELLAKRNSLEFYVDRAVRLLPTTSEELPKIRAAAERAILRRDSSQLVSVLNREQVDDHSLSMVLKVVDVGISMLTLLLAK